MRYVITYINITEEKRYHYVIVILNIGPRQCWCPTRVRLHNRSTHATQISDIPLFIKSNIYLLCSDPHFSIYPPKTNFVNLQCCEDLQGICFLFISLVRTLISYYIKHPNIISSLIFGLNLSRRIFVFCAKVMTLNYMTKKLGVLPDFFIGFYVHCLFYQKLSSLTLNTSS